MNSILNAETSAGKVLSGTEKEHTIGRNSGDQANILAEKFSTNEKRCQLIQDAIQSKIHFSIKEWGNLDLYALFAARDESNYMGIDGAKEFFTQLLLFVARPSVASEFNKAVSHGLDSIGRFLRWLDNVDNNYYFDEWSDFIQLELEAGDVPDDKLERLAKQYLTGAENTVFQFSWDKVSQPPAAVEANKPFEFKDSLQLVAALDRYFPNDAWPASKLEIASQPKMLSRLEELEEGRIKRENETTAERNAREMESAISSSIMLGPNFLSQTGDPQYDVKTRMRLPEGIKPVGDPLLDNAVRNLKEAEKMRQAQTSGKNSAARPTKKPAKAPAPPKKTSTKKKA